MAFTVSPLREVEIPAYARVEIEAFKTHPRFPMLWPRGLTEDLYAFYESDKHESFDNQERRIMKAIDDETGKIVAVSEWQFALDVEKQMKKEPVDPNGQPPSDWPIGGNWEMKRFFSLNSEKWTNQDLTGKPYIKLDILVTDPAFQRRGAGAQLISWGVKQADELGVVMALEATPAGLPLYKRFGFEEVEAIQADMKQFGWNQPYDPETAKRVWMIRQPAVGQEKAAFE